MPLAFFGGSKIQDIIGLVVYTPVVLNSSFRPEVKDNPEILMNAKAWNARVICRWLSDVLASAAQGYDIGFDEGRLTLVCHSMKLGGQLLFFCFLNPIHFHWIPPVEV